MKQVSLQLVKYIYRANKNKDKLPHLEALEDEFEILKLMVRLSVDIKLLKVKQQAEIAEIMERIGKQVSGWKKKSQ